METILITVIVCCLVGLGISSHGYFQYKDDSIAGLFIGFMLAFGVSILLLVMVGIVTHKTSEEKAAILEQERKDAIPTLYAKDLNNCEVFRFKPENKHWTYYTVCPGNSRVTTDHTYLETCGDRMCSQHEITTTNKKD